MPEAIPQAPELPEPEPVPVLKSKVLIGLGSLLQRQFLVKGGTLLGNIILARLLLPSKFGIYGIVAFIVQCFSSFGDVGFGPALIQKKGELQREELSTAFWTQIILVSLTVAGLWLVAPFVHRLYPTLPPHAPWLVRGLGLSLLFLSSKSIPVILMERALDFQRIALIEVLETAVFHVIAITLAIYHWEEWSFILAAIGRGFCGATLAYFLSSWRPEWMFRPSFVRPLVSFGLPYQLNFAVGFLKDAVAPLFVGAYIGTEAVGYLTWARTYAFTPLLLSESYGRIAFPALSRIQSERPLLTRAIEDSIRMLTFLMVPLTGMGMALAEPATAYLFGETWMAGLPAFYFYCTSPLAVGIFLPMYSGILALGHSRLILSMTGLLLVLEWGLGVPFILRYGFVGLAMNQPIIAAIFYFVYKRALAKEDIRPRILANVGMVLLATACGGALTWATSRGMGVRGFSVFPLFGVGLAVVYGLIYLFQPTLIREFWENVRRMWVRSDRPLCKKSF